MDQKRSLTAVEVAKQLNVSKNTVYEIIRRGEINSYRVGRKIRFTQEDVDDYIARFRHEKQTAPVSGIAVQSSLLNLSLKKEQEFIISGQDVILDILSNFLRQYGVHALRAYVGSFESLLSLYQGNVHAATSHLWDGDRDTYNTPYVRRLMPGTHAVIVNLSYRMQGFYVQKGNPKNIRDWQDLRRKEIRMLNRRKGSASRILLDEKLMKLGIDFSEITGYTDEIGSHLTLAKAVADGAADVGLGTQRIVRQLDNLEFVPLQEERYDLIIKKEHLDSFQVSTMLQILSSDEFRSELEGVTGNDYRDLGKIIEEV